MSHILELEHVDVGYGAVPVVRDLSLAVAAGEIAALLGPNGVGKTTTLRAVAGVIPIQSGTIRLNGRQQKGPLHIRAKKGLGVVAEERSILRGLSVRDNCKLAGVPLTAVTAVFPELERRAQISAGLLSGGEQQMLAMGMALAREPSVLLVDELSLGLAPMTVSRLLGVLREAAGSGLAVLLVEQHVERCLDVADYAYLLRRGRIELSGKAEDLRERLEEIEDAYFAAGDLP